MVQRARDYQPGELLPGTVYEVVRLIGAGGMGTVYDVEDTTIGKRYVLKTLHPQLGAREDLARRMQAEARTLARLNHPNIVEVITAGVTGDDLRLPFFVMERLNGQTLRVVLDKKGQIELPHAYHIAIDLLDALDHAHDKGVIHRDVKPDNIFLHRTSAGVTLTKLLDFGIQSLLDATIRETAGRFLGTLRYAAPEQLRGEKPTALVDVYAAGLVLYEMIAGHGPFDDEGEPHAIGAAHMDKPPPPLSRWAEVPRELESLVMATLAKDPAMRPRDAFTFAASLRNLKRALGAVDLREPRHGRRMSAPGLVESAARPSVEVSPPSPPGPEAEAASDVHDGASPLEWPHEQAIANSEEPQVRTLSAATAARARAGGRAVAFTSAALLVAGALVFAWRSARSTAAGGKSSPRPAMAVSHAAASPPAFAQPTAAAMPAARDGRIDLQATPAPSEPRPPPSASSTQPLPRRATPTRPPPSPRADRPGPGF